MLLLILGLIVLSVLFLLFLSIAVWLVQRNVEIDGISKRAVLVTGCDSGFGNLLVRSLDARGVRVFAGCLTQDGADNLKSCTSSSLTAFVLDITNRESVEKAVDFVKQHMNGHGLWGLVNNAGVMPTYAPVEWTSMEEYEFVCNVNLFGTISVTKAFLPLIRKSQGRIVNVCSVTSNCGVPGLSSYVISKAALKIFSVCLRRELLGSGVTIHTIEPGGFQTNITCQNRIEKILKDSYKRADQESRDFYGGNIFSYVYKGVRGIQYRSFISTNPQQVPDCMIHALLSKHPQQNYLVGLDAKVYLPIFSVLPPRLQDYIVGWPSPYGPKLKELEE